MEEKFRKLSCSVYIVIYSLIAILSFTPLFNSFSHEFRLILVLIGIAVAGIVFFVDAIFFKNKRTKLRENQKKITERKRFLVVLENIIKAKQLEERQVHYKQQTDERFLEIKDNSEIVTVVENFFPTIPVSIFLSKEHYNLFEFLLLDKSELGLEILWSNKYDLEHTRSIYVSGKIDANVLSEIEGFLNGNFAKLVKLISKFMNYESSFDYLFVALRLLQFGAASYYSQFFLDSYQINFKNIETLSLEECAFNYYSQCEDDIFSDPSISLFAYHMIYSKKFGETQNTDYYNFLNRRTELIEMITKNKESFDYRIFEARMRQKAPVIIEGYTIQDVDLMGGAEFEQFVAELFIKMGYKAEVTKHSGDFGVDVIAQKDSVKIGVQAKCYSGSVSNSAIQEVVAGMKYYGCEKGVVVTNSTFTKAATELAKANTIQLWDREVIISKISELFGKL